MNAVKPSLGAVAAVCSLHAMAQTPPSLTFLTNWYAEAEHGGFYQAQATGLYEKAGLKLTLKAGGPQVNSVQLMAAGQADCIISDNGQALQAWQVGIKSAIVATSFQTSPLVFITHDDVTSIESFKTKTFLLPAEAYTTYWPWSKGRFGLKQNQVRPYTFNVQPFLADKHMILSGYITSEPYALNQAKQPYRIYRLSDYGYPVYGNAIVCSLDAIHQKSDAIQRFVSASMQGWRDYLHNPSEGNRFIKKWNPAISEGQLAFSLQQMKAYELITGGDAKIHGVGYINPDRLKQTWDTLVKDQLIDPKKVPLSETYRLNFTQGKIKP
jgi:NitT/TauT family transport system substrate-binding protein